MNEFKVPSFEDGELELRCADDEIMIYGTHDGLRRLAELCMKLAGSRIDHTEHYHLEDFRLLTGDSLRGVLAVFPSSSA